MTSKERYYWYKSHGICTECGHQDARPNHTLCWECSLKMLSHHQEHPYELSTEQKYRHLQHQKRRKELLIAFGVCTTCQKRDAYPGKRKCKCCTEKNKIHQKNRSRQNGVMPNEVRRDGCHCAICGAEEQKVNYKVCEKCYDILRNNMLYARSCKKNENYFEKLNKAYCK